MFAVALLALVASPLLTLVGAALRATLLFWPTMLLLGAVHTVPGLEFVPALGWSGTWLVVALLSLLIPVGASASSD